VPFFLGKNGVETPASHSTNRRNALVGTGLGGALAAGDEDAEYDEEEGCGHEANYDVRIH
jgi:hypothetical protein